MSKVCVFQRHVNYFSLGIVLQGIEGVVRLTKYEYYYEFQQYL